MMNMDRQETQRGTTQPDADASKPAQMTPEGGQSPSAESHMEPNEQEFLKARIAELENAAGQFKDQLLRKAAEFENYKKRVENEYAERIRFANEDLLMELLPVVDDFERSLKMSKNRNPSEQDDVFTRGIDLIYQKLIKTLGALGMHHYEVVGKPFDPYFHDALMQMPKDDVPPHTVIEEVEKGFMLHGRVLRHAKVIVSGDNDRGADDQPGEESSGQANRTGDAGGAPDAEQGT